MNIKNTSLYKAIKQLEKENAPSSSLDELFRQTYASSLKNIIPDQITLFSVAYGRRFGKTLNLSAEAVINTSPNDLLKDKK
jgi:hypothetical protein